MNFHNAWNSAGNGLLQAHLRLTATRDAMSGSSREHRLMLVSAAIVCGGLLVATAASAQGSDGIAGLVNKAGTQADSVKLSLGKVFAAAGFAGAGFGGWNWWRKGKEGEQSHIKGSQIFVPILAGAALGAIGFVMIKAGESVGIQRSDMGVVPT
ncbi:hypothetical protein HF313_22905 [Massilia atriviolacea]|uniref:Uncharacterized protein n=1 Tax=Massilia atriviolacea TaxID=2495579 RepID=A0A430HCL5_9BURK|nr:DUF6750 family protein [Massilia atriviolacea]RSZ55247.1 hypothetical protein EJB06_30450 [Massilia atriviolacea]